MIVEIREIRFGAREHDLEIHLRHRVLRAPLGLSFSPEEIAAEAEDVHLGAFQSDALIGCLLLHRIDGVTVKMRQVAVDPRAQGLGVGRKLIEASEIKARALGMTEMQLHARETAVPFYLRLGYEVSGAPFAEVGLPHRKMRKAIG